MINLSFRSVIEQNPTLLLLGAHCDDIEIGCGGTIQQLISAYENLSIYWVVFSSDDIREKEAGRSADALLQKVKSRKIDILNYKNGFFPTEWDKIKDHFESLKQKINPGLIFTHYRHDLHQDHRVINELTWNTFRDHLILEYEIPKFDGDLGNPNFYVPLTDQERNTKISTVLNHFPSQASRQWFRKETFDALMKIRGIECNATSGYAEAFYGRKLVVK